MQSKHAEPPARSFDEMSAIGLSEEASRAVNKPSARLCQGNSE
jgi:hypothetical protein